MTLTVYMYQEKEGGRELSRIEYSVYASKQRIEDYIEKRREKLITATRNHTDNTKTNRTTIARKQKWEEKQLQGRFKKTNKPHLTRENMDVAKEILKEKLNLF